MSAARQEKPPRPHRLTWSLAIGGAMLVVLIAANIAAFVIPEELSHEDVRYEPPTPSVFRRLLWTDPSRDTVVSTGLDLFGNDKVAGHVFLTSPPPISRKGVQYHYQPSTTAPLTDYVIEGAPAGITIDPRSGLVEGVPSSPSGSFVTVIEGQVDSGHRAQQRFTLYVDDRYLPFGADARGRDVFRRILATMRYTLLPGLLAVLVGTVGGTVLGAYAGFRAGATRALLAGLITVIESIPGLLLVFLAAVASSYNIFVIMCVVGITILPETADGVMERVRAFRERDFVEAARELGMPDHYVLWNEIVWWNARSFLLTRLSHGFVYALLVEVTLSYLELTDRNTARLGTMLLDGRVEWFNGLSAAQAIASLAVLLLMISAFTLTERGVSSLWARQR